METNAEMEKIMMNFETYRREMSMSFSDEQDESIKLNAKSSEVTT